jgi:hypothetical protein
MPKGNNIILGSMDNKDRTTGNDPFEKKNEYDAGE